MISRRRAFTLIEIVTVMFVLSAALAATTLTLHALYRADRGLRDGLRRGEELDRLSDDFRTDLHVTESAAVAEPSAEPGAQLILTGPGNRRISYTIERWGVERAEHQGEQLQRRERYLVEGLRGMWEIDTNRQPSLVSLRLEPFPQLPRGMAGPLPERIVAASGLVKPLPVRPQEGATDARPE